MLLITKEELKELVDQIVSERLKKYVKELDPSKHYILIIPESVSLADVREALEPLRGAVNLVALQADNIKLLELS